MKSSCSVHPTKPAHWFCPKCKQMFCSDCIVKLDGGPIGGRKIIRFCPKCTVETEWIGGTDMIKPFWERLPKFFIYPLSPGTIIYMAFLSLGSLVSWSWIVQLVCWALMLNYAYAAMQRTILGNLMPPPIWDESIIRDFVQVFKQIGLYVVLFFLVLTVGAHLGAVMANLFILAALYLFPSMIIILVNTRSLLTALNPVAFMTLPLRIGKGYLVMFFILSLLFFAPYALLNYISAFLSPFLYNYILSLAQNYYTLISYHLMGYVLLQYHNEIGLNISVDDIQDSSVAVREKADDPATLELKRVEVLCREGKLDEAIDHIHQWRNTGGPLNAELSQRYYDLLKSKNRLQEILKFGPDYLPLLVEQGNKNKALEVFNECFTADPNFTTNPKALLKIGEWLADTGKPKDAIKVLSGMTKVYPDSPDVPMAYFRAAQLYNDRLMDGARAKKILEQVINKYPDHKMIQKFKTYLDHIK
jgi:tetratricopeptide (TPR) repeat protein